MALVYVANDFCNPYFSFLVAEIFLTKILVVNSYMMAGLCSMVYLTWQGFDWLVVLIDVSSLWWLVSLSVLQKKKRPQLNKHSKLMKVHILIILFFCSYNQFISWESHIYMANLYIYLFDWFLSRYGLCQCWLLGQNSCYYICCSLPWYSVRLILNS